MSICFLPCNIKEPIYIKNTLLYRVATPISLNIQLNKSKVYDIVCCIMSSCLDLDSFGYNKRINEFWGKKMKNGLCILHFSLRITEIYNIYSNIVITPIMGTNMIFNKFIETFHSCIYVYK